MLSKGQLSLFWQLHPFFELVGLMFSTFWLCFFNGFIHIVHATVADFDGVLVEDFVVFVILGEVFFNEA